MQPKRNIMEEAEAEVDMEVVMEDTEEVMEEEDIITLTTMHLNSNTNINNNINIKSMRKAKAARDSQKATNNPHYLI